MTTCEIRSFSGAILFALQSRKVTLLNFGELWGICQTATPHLPETPTDGSRRTFARYLIQSIKALEEDGLVQVHTKRSGEQISHITLTKDGSQCLSKTIFTHQERMGTRP